MAIAQIIHFGGKPSIDLHAPYATANGTIKKAIEALKEAKTPQHFVLGTHVQDKSAVQIISEWANVQDYSNFETTPEFESFISSVRGSLGAPSNILHVDLDRPALGPNGPATANVVEYVQTHFPASQATPEFRKQIEDDFLRFEEAFRNGVKGHLGMALGWVMEEQEHGSIEGEKAKCFFVARGWESMGDFESFMKTEACKKSLPILLGWKAPFNMWHVERKAIDGAEVDA
ncbi:MAG: hypothetical protein MMC23_003126 [Stictis urceolatum]|nr:hypothetical protein [Stictis urceolata]